MKNNFYLHELIRLFGSTAVAKMIFLPTEKNTMDSAEWKVQK